LGWQGYAYERLRNRWSALEAAVILGFFGAVCHLIPFVQTHHGAWWIAWQCLSTVALRIVTVWLFVNGGRSVLVVALLHAMSNVSTFLFPTYGSHSDPFVNFVILALVSGIITALWGSRTLAQFVHAR
jgi:CAAX protease family protein